MRRERLATPETWGQQQASSFFADNRDFTGSIDEGTGSGPSNGSASWHREAQKLGRSGSTPGREIRQTTGNSAKEKVGGEGTSAHNLRGSLGGQRCGEADPVPAWRRLNGTGRFFFFEACLRRMGGGSTRRTVDELIGLSHWFWMSLISAEENDCLQRQENDLGASRT